MIKLTNFQYFLCIIMGLHKEPKEIRFDGCSFVGTCPRCGQEILRDSQGNWS